MIPMIIPTALLRRKPGVPISLSLLSPEYGFEFTDGSGDRLICFPLRLSPSIVGQGSICDPLRSDLFSVIPHSISVASFIFSYLICHFLFFPNTDLSSLMVPATDSRLLCFRVAGSSLSGIIPLCRCPNRLISLFGFGLLMVFAQTIAVFVIRPADRHSISTTPFAGTMQ